MEKPKYFDMLADYLVNQTEQELESRLEEVTKELCDIPASKNLTASDIENISDNYQFNLELSEYKSELKLEMDCIRYQQYLNAKNESELNSFEVENC